MTDSTQPIQLPGTECHLLHSNGVGDDFEISVILPPPEIPGPFPVVYLTDANFSVGLGTGIIPMLSNGAEIPPVTVVCIGYPIGGDFARFASLRMRDFTPTVEARHVDAIGKMTGQAVECGGAARFLEFLTTELRDWIASRYDVTDDTTYIGDSAGGLFGTYTLLNQPNAFRRYLIGSPWLTYDHPLCFKYEETYAADHDDLPATVFLAAGADEDVLQPGVDPAILPILSDAKTAAYTRELAAKLESRNYPSLNLTMRIFAEETHYTLPPILIAHGLRRVFLNDPPD